MCRSFAGRVSPPPRQGKEQSGAHRRPQTKGRSLLRRAAGSVLVAQARSELPFGEGMSDVSGCVQPLQHLNHAPANDHGNRISAVCDEQKGAESFQAFTNVMA